MISARNLLQLDSYIYTKKQTIMTPKLKAFEYFVFKLTDWYKEAYGSDTIEGNDLSKLKIFKLHFFTTAITTSVSEDGLLGVFNKFYALPFGPVESDVYNDLGELRYFQISRSNLTLKGDIDIVDISSTVDKQLIDTAIDKIKTRYFNLIKASAFDLVDLSHKWSCWSIVFDFAKRNSNFSHQIPNELIKQESQKVFSIRVDYVL